MLSQYIIYESTKLFDLTCLFFFSTMKRLELAVPISHINHCHLVEYEDEILSILLSHCHFSLRSGEAQDVNYDLPALEKHILKRFILGKPVIQLDIPQV